jgi:hypothetical protein
MALYMWRFRELLQEQQSPNRRWACVRVNNALRCQISRRRMRAQGAGFQAQGCLVSGPPLRTQTLSWCIFAPGGAIVEPLLAITL